MPAGTNGYRWGRGSVRRRENSSVERSDKHGPKLDDQLKEEMEPMERSAHEPRREEWREPEPQSDHEPDIDWVPSGSYAGGTPPGLDRSEVETRTELGRHLNPSVFPADRDQLVRDAEGNHAPDGVLDMLRDLPAGQSYQTVQDVWSALGGGSEQRP